MTVLRSIVTRMRKQSVGPNKNEFSYIFAWYRISPTSSVFHLQLPAFLLPLHPLQQKMRNDETYSTFYISYIEQTQD